MVDGPEEEVRWEVVTAFDGEAELDRLLDSGWEPFAANYTQVGGAGERYLVYHLRHPRGPTARRRVDS